MQRNGKLLSPRQGKPCLCHNRELEGVVLSGGSQTRDTHSVCYTTSVICGTSKRKKGPFHRNRPEWWLPGLEERGNGVKKKKEINLHTMMLGQPRLHRPSHQGCEQNGDTDNDTDLR